MSVYKNGVLVPVAPAVHGAAEHSNITREIFLPACEGHIMAGTCSWDTINGYSIVIGDANLNEPFVFWTMKVPVDFVSFSSVKAIWASGTGNMHWQLAAMYAACTESIATHSDTPAVGLTAGGGEGVFSCQESANPLTLVNLAVGDILGLTFYRTGSHEDDTLDTEMLLYGLLFTYVANQ